MRKENKNLTKICILLALDLPDSDNFLSTLALSPFCISSTSSSEGLVPSLFWYICRWTKKVFTVCSLFKKVTSNFGIHFRLYAVFS